MSITTPTTIRPSSRFYAAFHRYLTTTTPRSCHPLHTRQPHPSHFTPPSTSPRITRHYASTTTTTSPSPTPPAPPTHYTLFPTTLPHGPPPASPFTPDLRALRREYLSLQSRSHPDKHPPHLKPRAEATSAAIGEAYRTLSCPLKRSVYLLGLRGVEMGEGMDVAPAEEDDEEFLEEVMEVRGRIDGAREEGEVEAVRRENEGRVEECVRGLERGFASLGGEGGDEEGVVRGLVRETVRLRYWIGVRESLDGWEEGRGGGALQH